MKVSAVLDTACLIFCCRAVWYCPGILTDTSCCAAGLKETLTASPQRKGKRSGQSGQAKAENKKLKKRPPSENEGWGTPFPLLFLRKEFGISLFVR